MRSPGFGRLRRQPGYGAFFSAATLARLADEMFSVGVVLFLLDRTGSPELAGATVAAITLPSLVTGPLLGAWLDVTGRRRALMVVDQLAITATLLGILVATGSAPDILIPFIALFAGFTYPLSFGGFTSLIPALVPDELLDSANALEATSFNLALVIGPALAGTLAAVLGPAAPLVVEAVLSLAVLPLLFVVPALDRPGVARGDRGLGETVAEGLRQIVAVPQLRGVTVAGALGLAGLGLLTVAFPLFAVEGLDAPRSSSGYMFAAFAVGSMAGALGLVRLQAIFPPDRVVVVGYAVFGALMLLWPLAGTLALLLVLIAVAGVADGPALTAQFAVRQRRVPRRLHGQVFTTAVSLKVGAFAAGAAVAGPVVVALGAAQTLLLAAAMQFAAAGIGYLLMRLPGRAGAASAS
ncbi:MAG: MFS transporter [Thermoleophilaceae bacterium]